MAGHTPYLRSTIVIDVLPWSPWMSVAVAPMVCVPLLIVFPIQEAEQAVVFVQVRSGLLSTVIAIDAMPLELVAEEAMLMAPLFLIVAPFAGELIATFGGLGGGAGVETVTGAD